MSAEPSWEQADPTFPYLDETPVQFACGNCGKAVEFMDSGLYRYEYRNQCPHCGWSRHVLFGYEGRKPCGELMQPVQADLISPRLRAQRCACGFIWVTYDEDWWSRLEPERQTKMINMAYLESERLNSGRTILIYPLPGIAPAPVIPENRLDAMPRVARRP